ncbi:MAG: hypothetical protein A2Y77_14750 [Planctomycetes bacterium RBG_13_62_9]|nr:MAG: hypothetical protein A2Y77_14750 [Planctomycetes bacterium RBG_13_62_9]
MASLLFYLCIVNVLHQTLDLEHTYLAVRLVESSGGQDTRSGDGGRAVGELQIHPAYVKDVNMILARKGSLLRYTLEDRKDRAKARRMFLEYVTYWPMVYGYPQTPESWARTHNGGPRGPEKSSTVDYWDKVRTQTIGNR